MTTKFTPGPWHVKPNSIGGPAVGPEEAVVADIRTYGGPHVGGQQHPQTAANARLIAAAPDLLEALQWYEAKAVQMGRAAIDQDSKLLLELMKEIAVEYGAQARAAIAKATGERP